MKIAGALALAAVVAACGRDGGGDRGKLSASGPTTTQGAYRAPPTFVAVGPGPGGRVVLVGRASAGARVRLATPDGQAVFTSADQDGVWRIVLPGAPSVRLFGLSMIRAGRAVQAEGYLAVTPAAAAAQLRAGAGARMLSGGGGPGIQTVDFDRKGGTVVSGAAAPRATVVLRVDGVEKGRTQADAMGRFAVALNEPLSLGEHGIQVDGAGSRIPRQVVVSPAPPLSEGPFRATVAPSGWRIDWMTPGGGAQTTLLLGPAASAP
ncbi:MAG: hypothetical protein ACR2FH_01975 [Caulobacteraceae bacterium]